MMEVHGALNKHYAAEAAKRVSDEMEVFQTDERHGANWKQNQAQGSNIGISTKKLNLNQKILLQNIEAIGQESVGGAPGEADMNVVTAGPKALTFRNQLRMLKTIQKVQRGAEVEFEQEFQGYEPIRNGPDVSIQWNQKVLLANICALSTAQGAKADADICNYKLKQ